MSAPFDDHLPKDGDLLQELMDEVAALSCRLPDMELSEIEAFKAERKAARNEIKDEPGHLGSVKVYSTLIRMCSEEIEGRKRFATA